MQDNIVTILNKQVAGSCTEEEKELLLGWLEESEENRRFYSLFMANCTLHQTLTSEALNRDTESMLMRLNARIEESDLSRSRFWKNGFTWAFAAAIALVLGFFALRGIGGAPAEPAAPPMELARNLTGNTVHMVLDDGTHVYLHPGSSIQYNVSTLPEGREVVLRGDAYFDVARNESRPFTVRTSNIGVRVLGTAFSLSESAEVSQVVLERGSVRILSPEGGNMVTLTPNQKATFKSLTGDIRVEPVYATAFVTNKYNLVAMSDVTVGQIVERLSSIFGKRIICKGGDEDKSYNIAFLKTDSLEDVLSIVEYLTGAQCDISK